MSWLVYHPATAYVTLSKNSVSLSKSLAEKINTDQVELAYDAELNKIRIRSAEAEEGFILKKTRIFAKGFYKHFGITALGKYSAYWDNKEAGIIVQLKPNFSVE